MHNVLLLSVFFSTTILDAPSTCVDAVSATGVAVIHVQAPPGVSDSVPNDSSVLLTETLLTQMTTFWSRFQQEPDSIHASKQSANQEDLQLFGIQTNDGTKWIMKRTVNVSALATRHPAVAADFAQAGLTAAQWTAARNALYKAIILGGLVETKAAEATDTSNVGKNIVFLVSHAKQLNDLSATGMWLPDPAKVEDAINQLRVQFMTKQPLVDVMLP